MNANEIKDILASKHSDDVFVQECRTRKGGVGYMDAWAMKKSWSRPMTIGYEIKVSRSDFLGDNKWPKYLRYCNMFYFVCPRGVMEPAETPEGVGLIFLPKEGKRLYTARKAPRRDVTDGDLAELYKYILMSRVKITDDSTYGKRVSRDKVSEWKAWIENKERNYRSGRSLSKRIRQLYDEKIRDVELENFKLKDNIARFGDVSRVLSELGIEPGFNAAGKIRAMSVDVDLGNIELLISKAKCLLHDALSDIRRKR